jgi:hypothetical protein
MKIGAISCLYMWLNVASQAQDTVVVFDRPGIAESPYIVAVKRCQIEAGVGYADFSGLSEAILPSVLLRKCIFKNTEIRAAFNYEPQMIGIIKDHIKNDFDPIALGVKSKICKEKGLLPESSFILNTYFPMQLIGKKNTGTFNVEGAFQFQNNFADVWSLNYNIGTLFGDRFPRGILSYATCLSVAVSNRIGIFSEIFGYQPFAKRGEIGVDFGVVFNPTKWSQIDFSVIDNVENQLHYGSLLVGYSFTFK